MQDRKKQLSRGQQAFRALNEAPLTTSERIKRSKAVISQWRSGYTKPNIDDRVKIEALYRIPVDSWEAKPGDPLLVSGNTTTAVSRVSALKAIEDTLAAVKAKSPGAEAGIPEALQAATALLDNAEPGVRIQAARLVGQLRVMQSKLPADDVPEEADRVDLSQLTDLEVSLWRYLFAKAAAAQMRAGYSTHWEAVLCILEVLLTAEVESADLVELRALASPIGVKINKEGVADWG